MSLHPTTSPVAPADGRHREPDAPTSLIPLTLRLLRRFPHNDDEQLFGIVGGPARPRLQPSLQVDPIELLVGCTAPVTWHGVAVVSGGSARRVEGTGPTATDQHADADIDDARRVTVAFAIDRTGRTASSVSNADGRVEFSSDDDVAGFVADVCRRLLGLPCPAEPRTTIELSTAEWLETMLHLAADPLTASLVRTWPDAVALHPAVSPGADPVLFCDPDVLVGVARRVASEWDWERLRLSAVRGDISLDEVTPSAAAWMDAPFLARWLLGARRPLDGLTDDLRLFLDPDLHERVFRVAAQSCLPG